MFKRIARWILRSEFASQERLISRLRKYCYPYLPEIVADGTDQTENVQMHLDVKHGVVLPPSKKIPIATTIVMGGDDEIIGSRIGNRTCLKQSIY